MTWQVITFLNCYFDLIEYYLHLKYAANDNDDCTRFDDETNSAEMSDHDGWIPKVTQSIQDLMDLPEKNSDGSEASHPTDDNNFSYLSHIDETMLDEEAHMAITRTSSQG